MATQTNIALNNGSDQLDRYLADSCIQTDNPLQWWIMNQKVYPDLVKLGISIHSIMGMCSFIFSFPLLIDNYVVTAVPVERSFSRGRILIPHLRNRLRGPTIQALMCFGDWSRMDHVTNTELEGYLLDKGHNVDAELDDEEDIEIV